jgi:signal transduction histidine kinase
MVVDFTPETLLLASLPQGLVAGNRQRQITFINPAATRLLGLDGDQWLWQSVDTFCEHFALPPLEALLECREAIYTSDQWIFLQTLALPASAPSDLGFAILLNPEDAEHRAMKNLIATISHEVRTPLAAMRGLADLLLRGVAGPMDQEQREFVTSIYQRANDTARLINNAIIVADLDAGALRTDHHPVDLKHMIDVALYSLRSQIAAKGLSLTLDLPDNLPPVLADFEQVRIAFYQLLDNAWRYTSAGGIVVRAIASAEFVLVQVEDSGCGILPEVLPHLFERFAHWDVPVNRIMAFGHGIGLGLEICKQLIERQGGAISVASTPGQGSCFSITLRVAAGSSHSARAG